MKNVNKQLTASKSKVKITMAHPTVAFYQGQYSKAINKWQELALLGRNRDDHLRKICQCLLDLECYQELILFISWVYTNFSSEVKIYRYIG